MNIPNRLTIVRIAMAPFFLVLFLWDFPFHYVTAGLVFALASITDLIDGRLARRNNLVTDLGKFLDPIADKILTTAAFLGFVVIGHMNVWALLLILTREFVVTSVRLMAAGKGTVVSANIWGKAKTVAQYVAILYLLAALEFSTWGGTLLAPFTLPDTAYQVPLTIGEIMLWAVAAMTAISGIKYVLDNRGHFDLSKR